MAFCPRPPPPQCVTMGTSLSPLASKASSPSFGRHPAALSNGMFSAFGRAAVPQSVMGAEPDGPPKVSSSGSTLKSGLRASTTKMVLPSFLETKASNSSSLATPPFLADMVTTDAPRRVDTDLALRSATRQKGIVVALARRACIASSSCDRVYSFCTSVEKWTFQFFSATFLPHMFCGEKSCRICLVRIV